MRWSFGTSFTLSVFLMVSSAAVTRAASAPVTIPDVKLTVKIYDYAGVSPRILGRARAEAARIYRRAGIETVWMVCAVDNRLGPREPACSQAPGFTSLVLRIVPKAMAEKFPAPPSWFGYAATTSNPGEFGSHSTVFFHRVQEEKARIPSIAISMGQLLGHIMAHEAGHLLLGRGSHSPSGLMHIPWQKKELLRATRGDLIFTRKQAGRIQAQWRERVAAAQVASAG